MARRLTRSFLDRRSWDLAPELLNKLLVSTRDDTRLAARIVEVEAYDGASDPGSHAYRGPTARNASMFAGAGRLYVYFTYGMHFCANVVAGAPDGDASAVLLRAAIPVAGLDLMRERRPAAHHDRLLLAGPARLASAFGLGRDDDGISLLRGPIGLYDDDTPPPARPGVSTRIGLAAGKGDDIPWRWFVAGDPHVSGPRRGPGPR